MQGYTSTISSYIVDTKFRVYKNTYLGLLYDNKSLVCMYGILFTYELLQYILNFVLKLNTNTNYSYDSTTLHEVVSTKTDNKRNERKVNILTKY